MYYVMIGQEGFHWSEFLVEMIPKHRVSDADQYLKNFFWKNIRVGCDLWAICYRILIVVQKSLHNSNNKGEQMITRVVESSSCGEFELERVRVIERQN